MTRKDYFGWEAVKVKSSFSKKYVSLAEAIEKGCNDLGTLFRLWQIAQMCETDPKSSSFPNLSLAKCSDLTFSNTFASSFCPDGFLKKEETLKKKSEEKSDGAPGVPILFICRESNISGCIKEGPEKGTKEIVGNIGQEKGDEPLFWLREVVNCKAEGHYFENGAEPSTPEKTAQTKYYNCLKKLLCDLNKQGLIDENVEPSNCAYLNINKRGGFSSCDQSKLAVYAERYHLFIQKEISIIHPKHIVVCGELNNDDIRETMESILHACGYQEYWVYPKHPSRYTKDVVPKEVKLSKKE